MPTSKSGASAASLQKYPSFGCHETPTGLDSRLFQMVFCVAMQWSRTGKPLCHACEMRSAAGAVRCTTPRIWCRRLACYSRERTVAEPEAFLMRAALNLSIDAYRLNSSRGEEVVLDEAVLIDTSPGVEAVALARERMTRLIGCLGRLNTKTRDIFLAHRVDGMSYQEIARQHRLSVSAVEKHIARATLAITSWMEGW